jgi:hypothetical protein
VVYRLRSRPLSQQPFTLDASWSNLSARRCRSLKWSLGERAGPQKISLYDEEHDLYRFPDGEFAFFSKEYAAERRLREMGISG